LAFASSVQFPLSFSEVPERLDLSAGSINQGLSILREVNALKVVVSPDSKRELFEPDLEMCRLITH
jgi:HTH-type transcriptional regulator, glycine betaine synthesis regulator